MLVNLSNVLNTEGKTETMSVALEMEDFSDGLGSYEITEKSDVNFTFTNIGVGKAKVEGNARMVFKTSCDRCLSDVPTVLELEFERVVMAPELVTDEEDDSEQDYMEGYQLNVETFMCQEILTNWPLKILCRDDCKGICPKCGQNLNIRECGCDTFVPDPRMAMLNDIFNANKEV